jgi:hypothetical protein
MNDSRASLPCEFGQNREKRKTAGSHSRPHHLTVLNHGDADRLPVDVVRIGAGRGHRTGG